MLNYNLHNIISLMSMQRSNFKQCYTYFLPILSMGKLIAPRPYQWVVLLQLLTPTTFLQLLIALNFSPTSNPLA